jgi:SMI1 / KNR4 family (SUKH-1)
MSLSDQYSKIVEDLSRLRAANVEVFGSGEHGFDRHAPLALDEVASFEERHKVHLPGDYREFLIRVGRGGAGPYYGLFDLGQMDDGFEYQKWQERDGFVGSLAEPFPFSAPWNDLTGYPDDDLADEDESAYEKALNTFEARYWKQLDGAIPICHLGCALRHWLVVSGGEAGTVWGDARADQNDLYPLKRSGSDRVSFLQWYRDWLDEALKKLP